MTRPVKVAVAFMVFAFVASLVGRFTMGDAWDDLSSTALPIVVGVCFIFVFLLGLRARRPKDNSTTNRQDTR